MSAYQNVYDVVRNIPYGETRSYGWVAVQIGKPKGARLVGWALRALPLETDIPWHRVIRKNEHVSIMHPSFTAQEQIRRLRAEGIEIDQNGFIKKRKTKKND